MKFDSFSEEELDQYIQKDIYLLMKCERCGYEEQVPTWVLAEFQDIERYRGKKDPIKSCLCIKCQKANMYPKEK